MTIIIIGLDKVDNNLGNADKVIDRAAMDGLGKMTERVVVNVQRHTPEDTGRLKNAVEGEVRRENNDWVGEVDAGTTPGVIVASVEGGTRPHWPPWGPGTELAAWAERKGIPPFLVARAIAQRGTIKRFGGPSRGAEMFSRGLADSMDFIRAEAGRMEVEIAAGLIG